jgi:hypothetical protein
MNWYLLIFFIIALGLYLYSRKLILEQESKLEKYSNFQKDKESKIAMEAFQQQEINKINFTTSQNASKYITQDNSLEFDKYISTMTPANLYARGMQSHHELRAFYSSGAFLDITPEEEKRVRNVILEMLNNLNSKNSAYYKYITYWLGKIQIAKASNKLESGMPHTLGNMIVMDSEWFKQPRMTTLIHEMTHVHQRMVPFEFDEIYQQMRYKPYNISDIPGMNAVLLLNRNNPDGMNPNWLWKCPKTGIHWWIGAVFPTSTPSSLTSVNCIALKLENDSTGNLYYLKQNPTPLRNLTEFVEYFGNDNGNNYHPNEISAKFGEWYLEDILGASTGKHYSQYEAYQIYKKHFNNLINTYYK